MPCLRTGGYVVAHRFSMRFLISLSLVFGLAASAPAQGRRLKDDDVKKLMEEAKKDVERFEDAVDSQFRKATIRSATKEVSIETYLKDLKKSAEVMRDRFKEDYSAGSEVASFLEQANAIEKRSSEGGASSAPRRSGRGYGERFRGSLRFTGSTGARARRAGR